MIKLFNIKIFRFLLVGGTGVLFNLIFFYIFKNYSNLSTLNIVIVVHFFVLLITFIFQKKFTFNKNDNSSSRFLKFAVNDIVYLTLDFLLTYYFVDYLLLDPIIGKALALLTLTPISFGIQSLWVFK